jgi:hypothetical protein
VAPSVAFRLGEKTADPLAMYLSDVFITEKLGKLATITDSYFGSPE